MCINLYWLNVQLRALLQKINPGRFLPPPTNARPREYGWISLLSHAACSGVLDLPTLISLQLPYHNIYNLRIPQLCSPRLMNLIIAPVSLTSTHNKVSRFLMCELLYFTIVLRNNVRVMSWIFSAPVRYFACYIFCTAFCTPLSTLLAGIFSWAPLIQFWNLGPFFKIVRFLLVFWVANISIVIFRD